MELLNGRWPCISMRIYSSWFSPRYYPRCGNLLTPLTKTTNICPRVTCRTSLVCCHLGGWSRDVGVFESLSEVSSCIIRALQSSTACFAFISIVNAFPPSSRLLHYFSRLLKCPVMQVCFLCSYVLALAIYSKHPPGAACHYSGLEPRD